MIIALSVLVVVLFFASYGYKSMYKKTAAELDVVKQENPRTGPKSRIVIKNDRISVYPTYTYKPIPKEL